MPSSYTSGSYRTPEEEFCALHRSLTFAVSRLHSLIETFPEVIAPLIPKLEHLPILFNETVDLKPFKKLRIGYHLIPSKNPRKKARPDSTEYNKEALQLITRIESMRRSRNVRKTFLRDCENHFFAENVESMDATRRMARSLLIDYEARERKRLRKIRLFERIDGFLGKNPSKALMDFIEGAREVPNLCPESAQIWREKGLQLFNLTYNKPEDRPEFLTGDKDASTSRKRSVIRERIGKSILSLAGATYSTEK